MDSDKYPLLKTRNLITDFLILKRRLENDENLLESDKQLVTSKPNENLANIIDYCVRKFNFELHLAMDNSSNFIKDYYNPRFPIFNNFLGLPQPSPQDITKLLNLPFYFYKKETFTAPFFTIVSLPHSDNENRRQKSKKILKYRKKSKERKNVPVACLGNNTFKLEEPLLFECSDTSLNLESVPKNIIKPSINHERKSIQMMRNAHNQFSRLSAEHSKDKLTVFAFTGQEGENSVSEESDSQIVLSESSSASSTREYYLPAATSSADTIKVAHAIGCENMYTQQIPKISSIGSNEAKLQNNIIYYHDKKQIEQNSVHLPTISNDDVFSNNSYCLSHSEPIHKSRHSNIIDDIKRRNPVMGNFRSLKNEFRDNKRLSIMVKKSDITGPLIPLDNLCDKVLMQLKINEINEDPGILLKGKQKLNEGQIDGKTEGNISETKLNQVNVNRVLPRFKMPAPLDWVKEIKDNKHILQQDVFENESINLSAQSSLSTLTSSNRNTIKNKSKTGNEVFIFGNNIYKEPKTATNENSKTEFVNTNVTKEMENKSNEQEFNLSNSNVSYREKGLGKVNAGLRILPSNDPVVSLPHHYDKKLMNSEETSAKYKKLSGFFDLSSQKSLITKLFIQSDVVIEGSGSGSEDELGVINKDQRKIMPFQIPQFEKKDLEEECGEKENSAPNKHSLDILHDLRAPTSNKENGKEFSENSSNNFDNAYVYSESLFNSNNHFQKLREMFDLKESKNKSCSRNITKDIYTCHPEKSCLNKRKTTGKVTPLNEIPFIETSEIENSRMPEPEIINLNKTPQLFMVHHIEKEESHSEEHMKTNSTLMLGEDPSAESNKKLKSEESLVKSTLIEMKDNKPLNEPPKPGQLVLENRQPAFLYDESGFPYTDLLGRILKNNIGIPVLQVTCYNDLITKNITVYDSNKISIHNSNFDPSIKPQITTVAKVTDQVGNPVSLYNNIGLPLTDEDGLLLHDWNGEILMTLDSRFFPLCCKNGTCIYLRNGLTWLSQRYKYIVTTQNKVQSDIEEDKETKSLRDFGNCMQSTSEKKDTSFHFMNRSNGNEIDLVNNHTMKAKTVSTQYEDNELKNYYIINKKWNNNIEEEVIRNENKNKSRSTAAEAILNLLYNKLVEKKTQPPKRNNHSMHSDTITTVNINPIFDIEGNCLTDKYGYPLYNKYGEPLLLYDKHGRAISDSFGGPIFNANGKQIVRNSKNNKPGNQLIHDSYQSQGIYMQPERPYCEQKEESITESMIAGEFDNSLTSYQESEPLLKIIERKDIRAWDLNNEVPSSVKSVYSLPSHTSRTRDANYNKSYQYIQHNDHYNNYASTQQIGSPNVQQKYFSTERNNRKIKNFELPPQFVQGYGPSGENDYYQYESETADSADGFEDAYDYVDDKNIKYIHVAPKGQSTSYYANNSYPKPNNSYYMQH